MLRPLIEIHLFVKSSGKPTESSDDEWVRLPVGLVKLPNRKNERDVVYEFSSTGKLREGFKITYTYDTDPKGQ